MLQRNIQDQLFQHIKQLLPPHIALVDVIAEQLYLSADSAYRRLRGETPLVLEEAVVLCKAFNISIDQLFNIQSNTVNFYSIQIDNNNYSFEKYLEGIYTDLQQLNSGKEKQIIYQAKDIPIFFYFNFQPLFAFRYFFWMKSILMHPDFINLKFNFNLLPPSIEKKGKDILKLYSQIPSIEIWNTESVNSVIAQIEYYREAGYFTSEEDITTLYDALKKTIAHLQLQADYGAKFLHDENPGFKQENFQLFYNRIVLGDNTILAIKDEKKSLYINYDVLNYLVTQDEQLCNNVYLKLQNMMRRSTMLSNVSEKQRNIFFNNLLRKIPERNFSTSAKAAKE